MAADPNQLYVFNHGTFDDTELWTHRDLQKLCMKLGLPSDGVRDTIVDRLCDWHRSNHGEAQKLWPAGKFTTLGVSVYRTSPAKPQGAGPAPSTPPRSPKRRLAVSPRFLSPLMSDAKRRQARTPSSIMRRGAQSERKSVMFSPYNGVRLIPDRHTLRFDGMDDEA